MTADRIINTFCHGSAVIDRRYIKGRSRAPHHNLRLARFWKNV